MRSWAGIVAYTALRAQETLWETKATRPVLFDGIRNQ